MRVTPRLEPGASPGTIQVSESSLPSRVSVVSYDKDQVDEHTLDDMTALSRDIGERAVTWVHVQGHGDGTVINKLGSEFQLHPLILEDVVNVGQRTKVEEYEDQLFIVVWMPIGSFEHLQKEQLSVILHRGGIVTVQAGHEDCLNPVRQRLKRARGRVRRTGPDYLAYAIVDTTIDHYFPYLERCGSALEDLEERALLSVEEDLAPMRECLRVLSRDSDSDADDLLSAECAVYWRDCQDHVSQLLDIIDSYRELASGLMGLHMAAVGNRMNEVMKVLTIIATLFMPMGFVAGLYGMNFNSEASPWNLPELQWYLGYPFALAVMALMALGLLWYFRKKGWIGGTSGKKGPQGHDERASSNSSPLESAGVP
jgi:magnesium transporter